MTKRILVIDDERSIRRSFELALEDTDYTVETAKSGDRGIELFHKEGYDLVYLDLRMPGLNGVETLRTLRRIDAEVPVYIITAFYDEFFGELKTAGEEGLDFDVLRKPIDAEEIMRITQGVLEGPVAYG